MVKSNHALQRTGLVAKAVDDLAAFGVDMRQPGPLFVGTFLLSNIVSNVPAVMLLLPLVQQSWATSSSSIVRRGAGFASIGIVTHASACR